MNDPGALRRLSDLLDRALERPEPERSSWLASLDGEDAALAPRLAELLARDASSMPTALPNRAPAFTAVDPAIDGPGLRTGQIVGPYRLERRLGRGGMGEVWLAQRDDGSLKRKVALKLPHLTWDAGLAERFAREREILAGLEHPNIARLYDVGVDRSGRSYMALEYVEGRPLDEYCKANASTIPSRLQLLLQAAEAIAFAHSRLVVHRDLKPGNLLVTAEGQVRLLDFGIAKLLESDRAQETALTRVAGRPLTPEYASPEQVRGEPLGTSTDVYSLAVIAFELLAGARPHTVARERAGELEHGQAPLASEVAADAQTRRLLKGDLDAILNKALKNDPAERYPTIDAFAQDLRRHLEGRAVAARPDSVAYRLTRFVQRHRMPVAAGALVVAVFVLALGFGATAVVIVALLLGLGAALWQARRAARERDRALALSARNEAVSEFLNTMLTQAARGGKALNADELLERSEALLEREFKDNPEHRAAVLAMIGNCAMTLGNPAKSLELCDRALAAARGSADVALLDRIVISRAHAISGAGRVDEARSILEEVIGRRSTQPEVRAEAHHYLAFGAMQKKDAAGSLHHATEALRCMRASPRPSARFEASLTAYLGFALHLNGRNDEADRHYAAAMRTMESLGQGRSPNAIALLNNWSIVNQAAGDLPKALGLSEQALAITAADSPEAPKSPFITVNRARTLDLMGRLTEAEAGYEEARQLADKLGVPPARECAEIGLASVAIARGDGEAGARRLAGLADGHGDQPPMVASNAQLRSIAEGRLALVRGKWTDAIALFSSVIGSRPPFAATVVGLLERAQAHRRAGRPDLALTDATDAVALATALQGRKPHSYLSGLAALALAELAQPGSATDVRRHARHAVEQLAATVDDQHPALAAARALAG